MGELRTVCAPAAAPAPAFNLLAWAWDGLVWLFAWLSDAVFTPGPVGKGSLTQVAPSTANSRTHAQEEYGDATVITYHYDDLYRLTAADYFTTTSGVEPPVMSFAYAYDPVGNPVSLRSRDELSYRPDPDAGLDPRRHQLLL